jgi:hypothetical protein
MVINDLNIARARCSSRPLKADPPLVIDPNAVLSLSAFQGFESVAGQRAQILKLYRRFRAIQLEPRSAIDSRECLDSLTGCEISSPLVPIADNHISEISERYVLRQA